MYTLKAIIWTITVVIVLILAGDWYISQPKQGVGEYPTSLLPTSVATAVPTATPQPTPPSLGTTYITSTDWPSKVQTVNQAYSCTPAGSPIRQGGQTMKATINGHDYCVTQASEGAAGSVYTTYTYAWADGVKTAKLTFTLRMVQCANYDEPKKTACKNEQASFDIGSMVDGVAEGLH